MKNLLFALVIVLCACSIQSDKNKTTTIGMFTPHVLFPIKYKGKIKKINENIYLAKENNGKVIVDRPLTNNDRKSINWNQKFEAYFNYEGLVTHCTIFNDQNQIVQTYQNQIIKSKVFTLNILEKDTLKEHLNFFYDSEGFIDKIESFAAPSNTMLGIEDFSTDKEGNIVNTEFRDTSNKFVMKFDMAIDKLGRRTGFKQFNNKNIQIFETNVVYNKNGVIEAKTEINEYGSKIVWKYTYTYDQKGNWITCVSSNNNTHLLITRNYEYFSN